MGCITFESNVICLTWNVDNNRLLIGLTNGSIQIWSYNSNLSNIAHDDHGAAFKNENPVKFVIEEEDEHELLQEKNNSREFYRRTDSEEAPPKVLLKKIWEKRFIFTYI